MKNLNRKTCNTCLKTKNYFHFYYNEGYKDNYENMCNSCKHDYYKKRTERIYFKQNPLGVKFCKGCGQTKNYVEYYRDLNATDGVHAKCIECTKKRNLEYARKNRENK